MKRTTTVNRGSLAVHGSTLLLSLAGSIVIATLAMFGARAHGVPSGIVIVAVACAGFVAGFLIRVRRAKPRQPHRISFRRGAWMIAVPALIGIALSAFLALPMVFLWIVAGLVGLGVAAAVFVARQMNGRAALGMAVVGALLGVATVVALSPTNLRSTVETTAKGNGLSAAQLSQLPQHISVGDAASLARDPRTGVVAGSIRETGQQTMTAQFTQTLQLAAVLALVSLLISLFVPRRFPWRLPQRFPLRFPLDRSAIAVPSQKGNR